VELVRQITVAGKAIDNVSAASYIREGERVDQT